MRTSGNRKDTAIFSTLSPLKSRQVACQHIPFVSLGRPATIPICLHKTVLECSANCFKGSSCCTASLRFATAQEVWASGNSLLPRQSVRMVKLASSRATRAYGPGQVRNQCEDVNAVGYLLATVLLLIGAVFLLPGWNTSTGLVLIMVSLVLFVCVNLHDLYAQLAGFDFKMPLVSLDPQLAFVEVAAPLVLAIGGLLFFIGTFLMFRVVRGDFDADVSEKVVNHAYGMLIAGPALWFLGSIQNAFQLYQKADTRVQLMHKAVSVPFVISTTLFLVSAVLFYESTYTLLPADILARRSAIIFAIVAAALLVIAAIVNIVRVLEMQQIDRLGGLLEPLRGGAQQRLDSERDEEATLLDREKYAHDVEEGSSYKQAVVTAEDGVQR